MRRTIAVVVGLGIVVAAGGPLAQSPESRPNSSAREPLGVLKVLAGSWTASGDGFTSTLIYDWALPGVLLRARNELRNGAGGLIGQYEGHYAWDPGQSRIVFRTVSRDGELHEGVVVSRGERLWHDARVLGGTIDGYRSVLVPVGTELHYRAKYQRSATDEDVLGAVPLIYRRLKPR